MESDAEFMERMSRAIPYNVHTLKAADLSRLFALARRGAAVENHGQDAKPSEVSSQPDAVKALLSYEQADQDGVMVLTSRQAIHEVAARIEQLEAALREIAKTTYGWEPGVWSDKEAYEYFASLFFGAQSKSRAALEEST